MPCEIVGLENAVIVEPRKTLRISHPAVMTAVFILLLVVWYGFRCMCGNVGWRFSYTVYCMCRDSLLSIYVYTCVTTYRKTYIPHTSIRTDKHIDTNRHMEAGNTTYSITAFLRSYFALIHGPVAEFSTITRWNIGHIIGYLLFRLRLTKHCILHTVQIED